MLVNCDPKLPLTFTSNTSAYGIGAVISRVFLTVYLSTGECNYKMEALSLVDGIKKFQQYLYTSHKSFLAVLCP